MIQTNETKKILYAICEGEEEIEVHNWCMSHASIRQSFMGNMVHSTIMLYIPPQKQMIPLIYGEEIPVGINLLIADAISREENIEYVNLVFPNC